MIYQSWLVFVCSFSPYCWLLLLLSRLLYIILYILCLLLDSSCVHQDPACQTDLRGAGSVPSPESRLSVGTLSFLAGWHQRSLRRGRWASCVKRDGGGTHMYVPRCLQIETERSSVIVSLCSTYHYSTIAFIH
jgi:hypothetical protein